MSDTRQHHQGKDFMLPEDSASWSGLLQLERLRPAGRSPRAEFFQEKAPFAAHIHPSVNWGLVLMVGGCFLLAASITAAVYFFSSSKHTPPPVRQVVALTLYRAHAPVPPDTLSLAVPPPPTAAEDEAPPAPPPPARVKTENEKKNPRPAKTRAAGRETSRRLGVAVEEVEVLHDAGLPPRAMEEQAKKFQGKKPTIEVRKVTPQETRPSIIQEEILR